MHWNERSAIVTGGAGGLGAATVRRLTDLGMQVVVFDRALDAGRALVEELGRGDAVGGDINRDEDVTAAIEAARALAPLAVVVNVAGGGAGGRTLSRDNQPMAIDAFRSTLELNTVGTFNVTRLAVAEMAGNESDEHGQRGVVVNTASIAGYEGQTGQVAYAASKAAVLGMSLPLGPRPGPGRDPGVCHRPGHHGDPPDGERPRFVEGEAGGEHHLPPAHGPTRRVRPAGGEHRDQPLPQRGEHQTGRGPPLPTQVGPIHGGRFRTVRRTDSTPRPSRAGGLTSRRRRPCGR